MNEPSKAVLREPKRFLVVSQYWTPDVVGDVSRVKQIVNELKRRGCGVTVLTTQPHYPRGDRKGQRFKMFSAGYEEGTLVFRVGMPSLEHRGFARRFILYSWFAAVSLLPSLVLGKDRIHWAFSQRVFSTYSSIPARLFLGRTVLSDVTDIWPEALANTGYLSPSSLAFSAARRVAKVAYISSSMLTTMTPQMKNLLSKGYRISPARVSVIPYAGKVLSVKGFVSTDGIEVLYFGNLGPAYDFDVILMAAYVLREKSVHFVIRGDGEDLDLLTRRSQSLALRNVTIIPETLTEQNLGSLISQASVLVLPMKDQIFRDVSFPGKLLEYQQTEKPVIQVGGGYPREIVAGHEFGLTVDAGDYQGLAEAIEKISSSPELRNMFSKNARTAKEKLPGEPQLVGSITELLSRIDQDRHTALRSQ